MQYWQPDNYNELYNHPGKKYLGVLLRDHSLNDCALYWNCDLKEKYRF